LSVLEDWCAENRVNLVLTTGGTGLGPRDVTPEATREVIEKELPGLGELMRSKTLKKSPLAALSRATAGSRRKTLIVNFPGSPKGAKECFEAVAQVLEHAVAMIHGGGHERRHDQV
jgi:molybdenum cofactor synthesis domain-containing protein